VLLLIFWLLWATNDKVKMAHLARFIPHLCQGTNYPGSFPEVRSLTKSKEKLYTLPQGKLLEKNLLVFW